MRTLNYNSYHDTRHKRFVIQNLLYRTINLSNENFLEENLDRIRRIQKFTNLPNYFINAKFNQFI